MILKELEKISRYHFSLDINPRKDEVYVRVKSTKVARKKRMYFKYNDISWVKERFKDLKKQAEAKKTRRKNMKKKWKVTKSDAVKYADKWFSKYIRERDTNCCTCWRYKWTLWTRSWHCWHCESRQRYNTRRDPKNCSWQCMWCNFAPTGKKDEHRKHLDKKRGKWTSKRMLTKSKKVAKQTAIAIMKIGDKYKKLYEKLSKW